MRNFANKIKDDQFATKKITKNNEYDLIVSITYNNNKMHITLLINIINYAIFMPMQKKFIITILNSVIFLYLIKLNSQFPKNLSPSPTVHNSHPLPPHTLSFHPIHTFFLSMSLIIFFFLEFGMWRLERHKDICIEYVLALCSLNTRKKKLHCFFDFCVSNMHNASWLVR